MQLALCHLMQLALCLRCRQERVGLSPTLSGARLWRDGADRKAPCQKAGPVHAFLQELTVMPSKKPKKPGEQVNSPTR